MEKKQHFYKLKSFKQVDDAELDALIRGCNAAAIKISNLLSEIKNEPFRRKKRVMKETIIREALRLADYCKNTGYYLVITDDNIENWYTKEDDRYKTKKLY